MKSQQTNQGRRQSAFQLRKHLHHLEDNQVLDYHIFGLYHEHVQVDKPDIEDALSRIPCQTQGKISLNDLKKRMSAIMPEFDTTMLNSVFQGKSEITAKDIMDLQNGDIINDYDPMSESLSLILDSNGVLDLKEMSQLMHQMGYNKLDRQDQIILTDILDIHQDKKIDRKDLREIFHHILQCQNHRQ